MVILAASATFIVGAVLCGAAPERWTLFGGRVLLGVAIGMNRPTLYSDLASSLPIGNSGL